ncbi:hypothetical protein EMCRGX_G018338 [Ephydatia muelleri]
MGCEDYDSSVRRLPNVDVRQQVLYASNDEIDAAGMHRVENVFWRGVKAWAHILLPNLRQKADADLKTALSIKSVVAADQLHADEEAMKTIQAVYPQCTNCHYHFKSQTLLDKHMCDGIREPQDALSIAMRHANELLSKMDLSVDGAIAHASNIFVDDAGEIPYATFEPNFYSVLGKAGECKDSGKVKISADGVYARLEEMQSQKIIRLSELPLVGKIRAVYQSIGTKSQALLAGGCKRGRPHSDGGKKKSRANFDKLDVSKNLLKWTKPELEAFLVHHHIKKRPATSLNLSGAFRNIWLTFYNEMVLFFTRISTE